MSIFIISEIGINHNGDLEEKEGINHLPAGEDFLRAIRIKILE